MVTVYCKLCLLVFSLLINIEILLSLELLELRVPSHVALGTRAHLSCRWKLAPTEVLYTVKWYKDGKEFFRHVPRDSEQHRKFPLPGVNVEESDASGSNVVLSEVKLETAGRYRCEISGDRPLFHTVSDYADMNIVVLPDKSPVITGLREMYKIGDDIEANCSSGESRPACQLSWYINSEPAPSTAVRSSVHKKYEDDIQSTTLLLHIKLTKEYFENNELRLKCLATVGNLYWQSVEMSTLVQTKDVQHNNYVLPKNQMTNSIGNHIETNIAASVSFARNIIVVTFLFNTIMFLINF